jgi:hypothetical protein
MRIRKVKVAGRSVIQESIVMRSGAGFSASRHRRFNKCMNNACAEEKAEEKTEEKAEERRGRRLSGESCG